ncbi:hypothetical protein ACLKA6_003798 [Drosophila palustris]
MLWHKLIGLAVLSLVLTQLEFVKSDIPASGCRSNFSSVAGKCLMFTRYYYNWFEADRHCRSMGAELLSVQNQTQLEQIGKWLRKETHSFREFWTSGNSLGGQKGTYYWQSTGELVPYLPWSNQPQPAKGDCLMLDSNYSYEFLMSITNCTNYMPLICEQQQ